MNPEISHSQVWQSVHQEIIITSGAGITADRVRTVLADVFASMARSSADRYDQAAALFEEVALAETLPTFLTVPTYTHHLVTPA